MRACLLQRIPAIATVPHVIVPNFVDDRGVPAAAPLQGELVSIGTFEPRKNQSYLLDIVAAARDKGMPLRLSLFGDGPDRAALEHKTRRLGMQALVSFPGFVRGAAQSLGCYRAYIHSARLENMPLTLIEALSQALPVFAPAVGGIPEIFDDGVEGRALPLDDADTAADRIIEWMRQPERMAQAGAAARRRFLRDFQSDVAATRLTGFLDATGSTQACVPAVDYAGRKAAALR
jgi:glycosyltransferase involved in cell wall biosynthesis